MIDVRTRLVGRQRELAALADTVGGGRPPRPRVVLVYGDPGIGKSALVRQWLADLDGCARVLRARGDDTEQDLAYGVLSQLMERGVEPCEPLAAGASFLDKLGEAPGDQPTVVLIDDAGTADEPSMHAVAFAARRLDADRVTVALVARTESVNRLPRGLVELIEDSPAGVVHLEGLDPADVAELAAQVCGRSLSPAAAMRLQIHTGGNPLYLLALLRELSWDQLEAPSDRPLPAPLDLASVVIGQLASCAREVQDVLVAAAVLGTRAPLEGVLALSGCTAGTLDAAVESGLVELVESADGDEVWFRHALLRAAVYHDLGPGRRAALHARAADIATGSLERVQHRLNATVGRDERVAAEAEMVARGLLARTGWSAAGRLMASAARISGDPIRRVRRQADAVDLLLQAGEVAAAIAVGAVMPDDATDHGAASAYARARLDAVCGRADLAVSGLRDAWRLATDAGDTDLAARIAQNLAVLLLVRGHATEASTWSEHPEPEAPFSLGSAMVSVTTLVSAGLTDQARAIVIGPDGEHEMNAQLVDRLVARGLFRLWTDDAAGAARDLRRAAVRGLGLAPATLMSMALTNLADAEYRLGRWDDAREHALLAVASVVDKGQMWVEAEAHAIAAVVLAGRGDFEGASAQAQAAHRVADTVGDAAALAWAAMASARIHQAAEEPEGMLDALALLSGTDIEPISRPGIQPWLELEAEGLAGTGDLEGATAVLDRLEPAVEQEGLRSGQLGVARLRAEIELRWGHGSAAVEIASAALAVGEGERPFPTALLQLTSGAALRATGRRHDAAAAIRSARDILLRLNAHPFVARCDRALAELGVVDIGPTGDPLASLTSQERSVAALAASGCSNREIAAQLIVSVKTVEYHLGHVYMKLGLRSRTQLAARLRAPNT